MNDQSIVQYKGTRNVAVPPWIIFELQRVAADDYISIDQAAERILRDALTARLLARASAVPA